MEKQVEMDEWETNEEFEERELKAREVSEAKQRETEEALIKERNVKAKRVKDQWKVRALFKPAHKVLQSRNKIWPSRAVSKRRDILYVHTTHFLYTVDGPRPCVLHKVVPSKATSEVMKLSRYHRVLRL